MNFAERFKLLTNSIFSTIDAVVSLGKAWESFTSILEGVKTAREALTAVEQASAGITAANTAAEIPANTAATASEVAKGKAAQTAAAETATAAATQLAANTAVAGSGAAASQASIPYVGPFLAVAAMASILALLATLPKFASGGIFKGASLHGDKNLARINSGEMILNNAQQKRLFDILNGKAGINSGSQEVEFKIRGKDLVAALSNQNASMAKIKGSL